MPRPLLALMLALAALPLAAGEADRFRELCAASATGEGADAAGAAGWWFNRSELGYCAHDRFWGDAAGGRDADPVPAIVDFRDQLAKRGIALLVVPVPPKAAIYPDRLPGSTLPATAPATTVQAQLHADLAAAGIDLLDLTPMLHAARQSGSEPYCRTDTHWSPYGIRLAARAIRDRIGAAPWLPPVPAAWTVVEEQRTIHGDQVPPGSSDEETLTAWAATPPAGIAAEDAASPVILLGDSHCLVFHIGQELHGSRAGLADQLGAALGLPLDVVAARGADATTPRANLARRARKPAYLAGKKLVIWCFASRAFTTSPNGWALVPVVR